MPTRNGNEYGLALGQCVLALLLLGGLGDARGEDPNPSFLLTGYLQELKVDNPGDPLSGGSLTVNGARVILPRNLLITMPGQYLTLSDLFRGKQPGWGEALAAPQAASGLAFADQPPPTLPVMVQALGNMVGGRYIAGVVNLMPQGFNEEGEGAGFIRAIDYDKGELLVGTLTGTATARVRINDALGVYGRKNSEKSGGELIDDRFTSDPGNAPVTASTGFPMCIPRVAPPAEDALCPRGNRRAAGDPGQPGRFTCGAVAAEPTAAPLSGCDPEKPAPLVVGDYITYSGMPIVDAPGTSFVAAHALQALTGIYTSPRADPAYVLVEVALVGTLGEPFPGIDQEQTSRFRIVGFTTDPARRVDVFVIDQEGDQEKERRLTTLTPQPTAQIGRIRIDLPAKANFLPVARDVRIRIEGHSSRKVVNGHLDSGQYTLPVSGYIAPENTRFGIPRLPVGVPFESFCFLKNGGGALATLGREGPAPKIGRLDPFPASGHADAQPMADGTRACP
ncbi:hypothetical protein ACYCAX_19175 [Pseudomonas sp. MT3]|uniref:hypothetical protein n=1 Tax=Pseudomonas sp. ATCC 13867 TaxID=1294143 RepID=UPI0002C4E99F|nr:hypothetical protein [Pseudomonas sp. ATCC 13867]AGI23135.1 hypothetical protein H681_06275 [Pseudomonas sp. ATCC 13867]